VSDFFGAQGLVLLHQRLELLPPCTAYATQQLLEQVENLDRQVRGFEHQMQTVFRPTPTIQLLLTLPGVGLMLAVVIALEVGSVARFATAEKLAAYAGTTPRPRERRQDPLRACPPGRQSLPRVGLRRSRQRMIPAAAGANFTGRNAVQTCGFSKHSQLDTQMRKRLEDNDYVEGWGRQRDLGFVTSALCPRFARVGPRNPGPVRAAGG
jgi:hypothetical protein